MASSSTSQLNRAVLRSVFQKTINFSRPNFSITSKFVPKIISTSSPLSSLNQTRSFARNSSDYGRQTPTSYGKVGGNTSTTAESNKDNSVAAAPPPPAGAPPPPAGDPWEEVKDPSGSGQNYWWNTETNETTALGAPKPQGGQAVATTAPASPVSRGGHKISCLMGALADGMAWGVGTSMASRAMDSVMGPRTMEVVHRDENDGGSAGGGGDSGLPPSDGGSYGSGGDDNSGGSWFGDESNNGFGEDSNWFGGDDDGGDEW